MATITKTIGTSSRDYSTITLWEADLDDGGIYSASDDAVGECYNDSVFDEFVTINGGGTIGLSSRRLTVASSDRHDGTAGSGARLVFTGADRPMFGGSTTQDTTVEWMEFDYNGQDVREGVQDVRYVNTCLVHGSNSNRGNYVTGLTKNIQTVHWTNNIIYELNNSNSGGAAGMRVDASSSDIKILNNTIHGIKTTGVGNCYGIVTKDQSNESVQNNLCTDCDARGFEEDSPSSATMDYNATDDTSAAGANSLNSITLADQYVSTVVGSEDLHLKIGSDAINAGVDLGTTPTNVEIDIDGRNRHTEGDIWDIGAHEFVSGGGPTPTFKPFFAINATRIVR